MKDLHTIKVGDTLKSVIEKLGQPASKMIVNFNFVLYFYKNEIWKVTIYILNGKVESIYKEERQ